MATCLKWLFLDGSSWVFTEYVGQKYVEICHGDICQTTLSWVFVAAYEDAQLQVDIAASILFEEAQYFATTYTQTLGRIPFIFREKVATLQIRPGEWMEQ